jgi:drug/metabolite transporter (DMT)-like permease
MGLGEWAALSAAFLWTISSLFWSGVRLSAWDMNFSKCVLGAVLVGLHLLAVSVLWGQAPLTAAPRTWGLLALSALVGIVIGDTCYFRCLQILGPRRALMVSTTSPIFAVVFGWIWLGEATMWLTIAGICITVLGVVMVIRDRKAGVEGGNLMPGSFSTGVVAGLLGAAFNAFGTVFSKLAMFEDGKSVCGFLEATWIRLFLSACMIFAVVVAQRALIPLWQKVREQGVWWRLLVGTTLGTWLGIGASMFAFKETSNIAIAQTLMSTCPLFAIPICWLLYKQRVSWLSFAGTIVAILGIWLVLQK